MRSKNSKRILKASNQIDSLSHAYRHSQVLFAAFESGLLEFLATQEKLQIQDISDALKLSEKGLWRLLTALCALKITEKKGTFFILSDNFRTLFNPNSDKYLGGMIAHEIHLQKRWLQLSESLRNGLPVKKSEKPGSLQDTKRFINAMADLGRRSSTEVIKKIKLKGHEHILDLGGGPGAYVKAFCDHYSDVKITLFDQQDTIRFAKKKLNSHSGFKRMFFKEGDLLTETYGNNFDVIFISNVIHIFGKDDILTILNKCNMALKPSGRLWIKDFFINKRQTGPEFSALFSLHMLLSTADGNCYTISEIKDLLQKSGFNPGQKIKLKNKSKMLEGIKSSVLRKVK
jgi:ubiquinone/menaquinone biosynthesis C-methylase UbiE